MVLHRVVHEDGYQLVESDVMKSKEGIDDQIDDGLLIEYLSPAWRRRFPFRFER